ncbi:hypothetical protein [Burkholderia sp. Bp9143]|uniref:hypothetical protein n=1 Tax=Burkholderia sp. Bp9143 TaxID=2184574 RepID=UPI001625B84C|nr:hypothetical protein [Burkholderia sp. Bp9143]
MKAGARERRADMPPGFCLKNIGTKLLKKFRCPCDPEHRAAPPAPIGTQCAD